MSSIYLTIKYNSTLALSRIIRNCLDQESIMILATNPVNWTAQPDLDGQMSVVVCRLSSSVVCRRLSASAVSKTADIMTQCFI